MTLTTGSGLSATSRLSRSPTSKPGGALGAILAAMWPRPCRAARAAAGTRRGAANQGIIARTCLLRDATPVAESIVPGALPARPRRSLTTTSIRGKAGLALSRIGRSVALRASAAR